MKLSNQINQFINKLSRRELLVGDCESKEVLTVTQEHILMLIADNEKITNSKLAEELGISAAAITKAVKVLQERELVNAGRNHQDERQIELILSEKGRPFALEHARHHQKTISTYEDILTEFTPEEQQIIERFLNKLESVIG